MVLDFPIVREGGVKNEFLVRGNRTVSNGTQSFGN